MAERFKAVVLKTIDGVTRPGVQIPLPPPVCEFEPFLEFPHTTPQDDTIIFPAAWNIGRNFSRCLPSFMRSVLKKYFLISVYWSMFMQALTAWSRRYCPSTGSG